MTAPATEKAAPIPAEVLALRDRLLAEHERLSHALALRKGVHVLHDGDIGKLATLVLDAAILADRASREERIREARPSLPDSREEQIRGDGQGFVQLPDGWLAIELRAVEEELEKWPAGLRASFERLFHDRTRARQGGNNG